MERNKKSNKRIGGKMKSNIIKYIFIAFAIFIIGFAIYKMNVNENSNEVEVQNEVTQTSQKTESTLRIGIPDFDNINPLITKNQDIMPLKTKKFWCAWITTCL